MGTTDCADFSDYLDQKDHVMGRFTVLLRHEFKNLSNLRNLWSKFL